MDKEVVVHIHNGILLSHKRNTFESVLMRWMNLEPITQSEVSQRKTNIFLKSIYLFDHSESECSMWDIVP